MRKGIKEALLRVTVIVDHAETGCSQEVHGHDKAGEKFHLGALPSAAQLYHTFETRRADQEKHRRSGAPVDCGGDYLLDHPLTRTRGPRWTVGRGCCGLPHPSPASAIASRCSRRSVLTASRACQRSTLAIQENGVAFFGGHASSGESARGFKGRTRAEVKEISVRNQKR